jgi:hypothetical protein
MARIFCPARATAARPLALTGSSQFRRTATMKSALRKRPRVVANSDSTSKQAMAR